MCDITAVSRQCFGKCQSQQHKARKVRKLQRSKRRPSQHGTFANVKDGIPNNPTCPAKKRINVRGKHTNRRQKSRRTTSVFSGIVPAACLFKTLHKRLKTKAKMGRLRLPATIGNANVLIVRVRAPFCRSQTNNACFYPE